MTKHVADKKEIRTFYKGIDSIPLRNQGGCLFFCYAFYLWLEKNNYDDSSFSIIDYRNPDDPDEGDSIGNNEAFIQGKNDKAMSATHFTWVYDGQEYDSNGIVLESYKPDYWQHVKFDDLMKKHMVDKFCINALHNGSWNTNFERKPAMQVIKEKLGIDIPKTIGIKLDDYTGYVVE